MSKKIKYSDQPPGDEPVGELVRVRDTLPPAEVFRAEIEQNEKPRFRFRFRFVGLPFVKNRRNPTRARTTRAKA